ncbi:MAG: ATP-dependent DNA helicase RecG [Pseudomonadota bacterium]
MSASPSAHADTLLAPLTTLKVTPRTARLLQNLCGDRLIDVLWHLPFDLQTFTRYERLSQAPSDAPVAVVVRVIGYNIPPSRRLPIRVHTDDQGARLDLVFFGNARQWIPKTLKKDETYLIFGTIEDYRGRRQVVHPDRTLSLAKADTAAMSFPRYPLTKGMTNLGFLAVRDQVLARLPELREWIAPARRQDWPDWAQAVRTVHLLTNDAPLAPEHPARRRLAYDELLAEQIAIHSRRQHIHAQENHPTKATGHLTRQVRHNLPFTLTKAQETALIEITADQSKPHVMHRLLQGDVGSGKTVIALLAMLGAIEAGGQAALMAPTEILARQHWQTIEPMLASLEIRAVLFTGRERRKKREEIYQDLAMGRIDLMIGTHTLAQPALSFQKLRLAVIDEQHRFGVDQRRVFARKTEGCDLLCMTATPIPRTLQLMAYGDLDITNLREKPPGRHPITTRVMSLDRQNELIRTLKDSPDHHAFWICPAIDSDKIENATDRYESLYKEFGDQVGLIHGRMKGPEQDAVMKKFQDRKIRILVATTVVEIGVDVPHANLMIIEDAQRFGLAQLHQLRGRVGRSEVSSYCLLLFAPPLSAPARERLNIMRESNDGFIIAEKDLQIRKGGDVLGTRQSGMPLLRLVDEDAHIDLIQQANDDAAEIMTRDPDLTSPQGTALRELLKLFGKNIEKNTID